MSFPDSSSELTTILVVSNIKRSKEWYLGVLGADLHSEYGGTSLVVKVLSNWLLLVTGGGPSSDKPDVTMAKPKDPNVVDHSFTIRVKNCQKTYKVLKDRGAKFLTPPVDHGTEVRAFFRDPDGHLFEISQYKG